MQPYTASSSDSLQRAEGRSTHAGHEFSAWTLSHRKRAMDLALVLTFLPLLVLILAALSLAVLVTSGTPVLFRQQRRGKNGAPFVIYKFRTMRPAQVRPPSAIAFQSAHRITWFGAILRKSKLDELPQIFNVLVGDMSLVGPRPKVPEQELEAMPCRPGVTGAATLAFAREEAMLHGMAAKNVDEYFQRTILSTKRRLDAEYQRQATFWSDLRILVKTVMGRWDSDPWETPLGDYPDDHLQACNQTACAPQ